MSRNLRFCIVMKSVFGGMGLFEMSSSCRCIGWPREFRDFFGKSSRSLKGPRIDLESELLEASRTFREGKFTEQKKASKPSEVMELFEIFMNSNCEKWNLEANSTINWSELTTFSAEEKSILNN